MSLESLIVQDVVIKNGERKKNCTYVSILSDVPYGTISDQLWASGTKLVISDAQRGDQASKNRSSWSPRDGES